MLVIKEFSLLKKGEEKGKEYFRPQGRAPEVTARKAGNTGLLVIGFSKELISREYLPTDEDL